MHYPQNCILSGALNKTKHITMTINKHIKHVIIQVALVVHYGVISEVLIFTMIINLKISYFAETCE